MVELFDSLQGLDVAFVLDFRINLALFLQL